MGRLEEQRHVSTAAAIEKSGTADTMVSQISGPALAGPAAPATTALIQQQANKYIKYKMKFALLFFPFYIFREHIFNLFSVFNIRPRNL